MKYSPSSRDALNAHCREVIRSCLNIVEQHGDTYVAIHKDDEIDCVVLVSMIRSYPIMSIIVADMSSNLIKAQEGGTSNGISSSMQTSSEPRFS